MSRKNPPKPQKGDDRQRSRPRAQDSLAQAETLIEAGKPDEAIEILLPLAERYTHDLNFQYLLGYAYVQANDLWRAVARYRKAAALGQDPSIWITLSRLYLELDLQVLCLEALRRAFRHNQAHPALVDALQNISMIENDIRAVADSLDISLKAAEEGLRLMEDGQIALHTDHYSACIEINRKAIKFLKTFPAPYNNTSLAQFFRGQPQEAIQTARQVLENHPGNIHALGNLVRFLAWTGQENEARAVWDVLRSIAPPNDDLRLKMIESAAIICDDSMVLKLLAEVDAGKQKLSLRNRFYRAIAEANLRLPTARRRLAELTAELPKAGEILQAVKNGQPGLGWAQRFPYFHVSDLIPQHAVDSMFELLKQAEETRSPRNRRELQRFSERFPQIVLVGKKMILENQQPEAGIKLLAAVGTPAAYAELREFGLSQAGSDEVRMKALFALLEAGQIKPGDALRIWQKGEWRQVQLRSYEVSENAIRDYSPRVADLLNEGVEAFQANQLAEAENLFLNALKLEPGAIEAYNNLGTLYARRADHEKAKAMFQQALEIDPQYVMARCNLALYMVDEKLIEAAETMLAPLVDVQRFDPQALAFLSYVRARIAISKSEYDGAQEQLKIALKLNPDVADAQALLQRLEMMQKVRLGMNSWQEQAEIRQRSVRAKQQKQIDTSEPTLAAMLGIYTKEVLTGMARVILPWSGWSTLKKGELQLYLAEQLTNSVVLEHIITDLKPEERRALRRVLDSGGYLNWQEFEAVFGNDLEETPYWQYHLPKTSMGRLRVRGLLVEATVQEQLFLAIPLELRAPLQTRL